MSLDGCLPGFGDMPRQKAPKRNRDREDAGKSDRSYAKHDLLRKYVSAQASAARWKFGGCGVLVDFHAGDGRGVEKPQGDLFGPNPSQTTAEVLVKLGAQLGVPVILCERDRERRAVLEQRFAPLGHDVTIIRDHKLAAGALPEGVRWAAVVNDPCGPAGHGVEAMSDLAARVPVVDFAIVWNQAGWIGPRAYAVKHPECPKGIGMARLLWMGEPAADPKEEWQPAVREWARRLGRRQVAVTRLIKQSARFQFRVMVVSNRVTDKVRGDTHLDRCIEGGIVQCN